MDHENTSHINLSFHICVTINLIKNENDFFLLENLFLLQSLINLIKWYKDNKEMTTENIDQNKIIEQNI